MKIEVDGNRVFYSSGGRKHSEGRPYLMFLHGSGFNHFSWVLQSRAFAYDDYNVVAADMPGHGFSDGKPLANIEEQAQWALKLLDAIGAGSAVLVGHSQGGLIALEMARMAPDRIDAIVFIATATAIPVNEQLIAQAENKPAAAFASMVDWAHGPQAHMYDNTVPGGSHVDYGVHVMALSAPGTLATDLKACAAYDGGDSAAKALKCPVLCIFADRDRMTPLKAGRKLAEMIANCELHVIENSGHTIPTERPREVNALMRAFLKRLGNQQAA